ncbi:MAG: cadmium-translocating P-type ATPase [Turicibacter sp.]|nr:cadmium-translocating P-type ATPase [Turicibacter sp.]
MEKFEMRVGGLDCAGCASKLQKSIEEIPHVANANVDFLSKKVKLGYEDYNYDDILGLVEAAARKHNCHLEEEEEQSSIGFAHHLKFRLLRYTLGFILYGLNFSPMFAGTSLMALLSFAVFGYDVIFNSLKSFLKKDFFNENFLMTLAGTAATLTGMADEAVLVMAFFQIGEFFQDMAVEKSRKSIAGLMDLKAESATRIVDGVMEQIDPSVVQIGDLLVVKPGEKVPLDGIVMEGSSQLDLSSLLGESVPRMIGATEEILSGAVNLTGTLMVQVTKAYEDSTVSKILELVENASSKKSSTERFITKFARIYTPIIVVLAILLMTIPTLIMPADYRQWIYRGIVFLLVACPCALHLSVPLSFFSGVGRASKNGILIKGSTYLQTLSEVGIAVFDKTGTLTKGNFKVVETAGHPNTLAMAAALEQYSTHPIAKSILDAYPEPLVATEVEEIPGHGLKGVVEGEEILVGNSRLMEKYGIKAQYKGAKTAVHVAKNGGYQGYILIADEVKADSGAAIAMLKQLGIRTVMMTGDRTEVARELADELGIDEVYSELLPNQKVQTLEALYGKYPHQKIAFTGDGINDAPVLTRCDVGIAMGGIGSDAAIEAADAVIMTDELSKLATAIKISKSTIRTVRQNIYMVLALKFIVLILAVFGMSDILWAVLADTGVTLLAVLNSIRKQSQY